MNLQDFHSRPEVTETIAQSVQTVLAQIGEDPNREGLIKTPHRVGEALQFLCKGYNEDAEAILRSALFEEDYRQMVVVKDIDFYSLCEHHMLPFFGKVHVAYIPNGHITGLSKIARVVDVFARRLQVQERLTTQIKDCIQNTLNPLGVANRDRCARKLSMCAGGRSGGRAADTGFFEQADRFATSRSRHRPHCECEERAVYGAVGHERGD